MRNKYKNQFGGSCIETFFVAIFTVLIITIIGIGFFFGAAFVFNHLGVNAEIAAINSMREQVKNTPPKESHLIYSQVSQYNQMIAVKKSFRNSNFFGWTVPKEWESVKPIEIPKENSN